MPIETEQAWKQLQARAGVVLASTAVLVIFTMAHHPTGHGDGAPFSLANIVHAVMVVLLLAQFWALSIFSLARPGCGWALGGWIVYGASVFAHLIAGTVNGFIVPALAARGDLPHEVFAVMWAVNQGFANLGIQLTGLGFALWSVSLLKGAGWPGRVTGLAGLVAAIVPSALLLSGTISLNVAGAFVAYGLHAAWLILLGLMMWQRRT